MLTLRKALKQIREDLAADNVSYLDGPRMYECDKGTLYVRNAHADGGNRLLGLFEAELVNARGETVRTYEV